MLIGGGSDGKVRSMAFRALPADAALLLPIGRRGAAAWSASPLAAANAGGRPSTAGGDRQARVPDSARPRLHPGQGQSGRRQTPAREAARDRTRSGDLVSRCGPGPGERQHRGAAPLAGAGKRPGLERPDEAGGEARGPLPARLHLHQRRRSFSHEPVGGRPPPRSHLADQAQGQYPPGLLSELSPPRTCRRFKARCRWVRFWKPRRGRRPSSSPTR